MFTDGMQKQALCNVLYGHPLGMDPDSLDDAYYYLYGFIMDFRKEDGDFQDIIQALYRLKSGNKDLATIIEEIVEMKPGQQIKGGESLQEIEEQEEFKEIEFFWDLWVPRGYPTLLGAWPGTGKTYVVLDIARRASEGLPAPDGTPLDIRTGNVIFVDAEDMLQEIASRARAWGMNTSKFYPMRRPDRDIIDLGNRYYQDKLLTKCHALKPDLLIIDSFSSAHLKGESAIEDVRELILFLDRLARYFNMAEIIVHHPRKPPQGITQSITMHDMRGSGYLSQIARMMIGMDVIKSGPDETPNGPRRMKVMKTNFDLYPKPLGISFEPAPNNQKKAILSYNNDIFFVPPATVTDECSRWLLDVLSDGPLPYNKIKLYGKDEGFGENAIQRARETLNGKIGDTIGPKTRGNKWCLIKESEEDEAS